MTFDLQEALAKGDAAGFVAYVKEHSDAPEQYVNYAGMMEQALAVDVNPDQDGVQTDADLRKFVDKSYEALKKRADANQMALGADSGGGIMGFFAEIANMFKTGNWDLTKLLDSLMSMFNSTATREQAGALQEEATASAEAATKALQDSTSDGAKTLRQQFGSDVKEVLDQTEEVKAPAASPGIPGLSL